jgi:hypothetical protein
VRHLLLVLAMAAACNNGKSKDTVDRAAASSRATSTAPSAAAPTASTRVTLTTDHVTLLQPEAVIDKRLADPEGFAVLIKAATNAVAIYDGSHPDVLPGEVDIVLVARPNRVRCWLVGAKGDLEVPELEGPFANLPKVAVREGNVGAVATLTRAGGAKGGPRAPYLPATWKAAAGRHGSEIDGVIDAAWAR